MLGSKKEDGTHVVDLLQNYTATTMLANSEFVALLKQANTDSSKMAEVIGVSEAQLRFVTNTAVSYTHLQSFFASKIKGTRNKYRLSVGVWSSCLLYTSRCV